MSAVLVLSCSYMCARCTQACSHVGLERCLVQGGGNVRSSLAWVLHTVLPTLTRTQLCAGVRVPILLQASVCVVGLLVALVTPGREAER